MAQFIVYVLKSKDTDHYYVGQTSDLEKRLLQHNSGNIYWTKRYQLKSHAGRDWLEKKCLCP